MPSNLMELGMLLGTILETLMVDTTLVEPMILPRRVQYSRCYWLIPL